MSASKYTWLTNSRSKDSYLGKLSEKNNIHLTEFEILTAVMFEYFAENNVDFAVVEVGLGGKYDSTNVIKEPLCSILLQT